LFTWFVYYSLNLSIAPRRHIGDVELKLHRFVISTPVEDVVSFTLQSFYIREGIKMVVADSEL
jgi:hypothetical protein